MSSDDRRDLRAEITERLIEAIGSGTAPWQVPWDPKASAAFAARAVNPVTGAAYGGMNRILLSMEGREDPRFVTYRQAESMGWQVRRGERGTPICKVVERRFTEEVDVPGKGREEVERTVPVLKSYVVFSAEQIDGIPTLEDWARRCLPERAFEPSVEAELIMEAMESRTGLRRILSDSAFYRPSDDVIGLPPKEAFRSEEGYYGTLLHELAHATSDPSRLDRKLSGAFGSAEYAAEEVRVEIAAWMISRSIGMPISEEHVRQHEAYCKSWLSKLRDDKGEVFRASAAAGRIADYMIGLGRELAIERGMADATGFAIKPEKAPEIPQERIPMLAGTEWEGRGVELPQDGAKTAGTLEALDRARGFAIQRAGRRLIAHDLSRLSVPDDAEPGRQLSVDYGRMRDGKAWTRIWDRERSAGMSR